MKIETPDTDHRILSFEYGHGLQNFSNHTAPDRDQGSKKVEVKLKFIVIYIYIIEKLKMDYDLLLFRNIIYIRNS